MLYDLHDMQRTVFGALASFSNTGAQFFSHPLSPLAYTPVSRQLAAGYELIHRIGKDYQKPEWGIDEVIVENEPVPIDIDVCMDKPFCQLLSFQQQHPRAATLPRVLIVAPLSGHHATLLRDTVRTMLRTHNVYVTDWLDARMVSLGYGSFHLDDYVAYVGDFLTYLGTDIHVMAVCQPTVPVLAAVSLMAQAGQDTLPKSLILMGGPIDTRRSPTQVNRLATTKSYSWFENNLIHRVPARYEGAGRRVYPGFLQHAGFLAMNPDRHMLSHYDFYRQLVRGQDNDAEAHKRFYDDYNAVLDMAAEFYLDTIRVVFQEHLLPRGLWEIDGELIDVSAIDRCALLTIEGELDDISGLGQTHVAQELCTGIPAAKKQTLTVEGSGHYGIFSGRRWRNIVYPQVRDFIAAQQ